MKKNQTVNAKTKVMWSDSMWSNEWANRWNETNEQDRGRVGRVAEMVIRQWLRRNSTVSSHVGKIAAQGRTDVTVTRGKNRARLEIKTACGEIGDIGRSQYVAYCSEVFSGSDLSTAFHVFTVAQFREMLASYPGRGQLTKINSQRGTVNIQSFYSAGRPKASKPIREYLDSVCESMPTLKQWETMLENGEL